MKDDNGLIMITEDMTLWQFPSKEVLKHIETQLDSSWLTVRLMQVDTLE
jgi:hypothetical protein